MNDDMFTFDTTPFMNGLKKISSGMTTMRQNAQAMAKGVSKGMMNVVSKIGLVALAFKGVKSVIKEMPEIGKTFGIAKNIIMKNFLFPLRKAVFPLLQKLLNWVRDNRAMFVKWGQSLVNVFKTVGGWIKEFITLGKQVGNVFLDFINKTFGSEIKSFQELLNVISFKLAVVVEFLKIALKPVFTFIKDLANFLGGIFVNAVETAISLFSGFLTGIKGIGEPLTGIYNKIKSIAENLFKANTQGNSLKTVFQTIGEVLGGITKFIAEMVDSFLGGLKPAIEEIASPLQIIVDKFKEIWELIFGSDEMVTGWGKLFGDLGSILGTALMGTLDIVGEMLGEISLMIKLLKGDLSFGEYKQAMNTLHEEGKARRQRYVALGKAGMSESELQELEKDPEATAQHAIQLLQGGDQVGMIKNESRGDVFVDMTGTNINLASGTPEEAQQAGMTFAQSMAEQFKKELERGGVK
jgi:hypothetical protein